MLTYPYIRAIVTRNFCIVALCLLLSGLSALFSPLSYADGGGIIKETINLTCQKVMACPSGQVGQITYQFSGRVQRSSASGYCDRNGPTGTGWSLISNTCTAAVTFSHNSYETTTSACPAAQPSGVINMRRDFEVWSDGSKRNYSAWYETGRTCAAIKSSTETEFQTLACPSATPSGTWKQSRTYDLWSDGSKKNYSAWTDVTKTCAAVKSSTETETQSLSCPSTHPSGTWTQSRTYDLWSDGSKKNYSAWTDVTKTCAAVKSSTQTETQSLSCPSSHPSGTWTQSRTYDLWSDGSKKNYSAWTDVTKTCAAIKSSTQTETQSLSCPSTHPSGTWTQSRTYDLWSDGERKNHSAWTDVTKTCAAVKSSTETETQSLSCPSTHPSGSWTQSRTYDQWSDGERKNYSTWTDVTKTCAAVKSSAETETRTVACPAASPTGIWTQRRSYEAWSDGTTKNYGEWIDVTVCQNQAPVAQDISIKTKEDTSVSVTLLATDDHSNLTYEIVNSPANGVATISGNTLTFTPAPDWNGSTSLAYRATDPYGLYSAPARVSIEVEPVNDAPISKALSMTVAEDKTASIRLEATDIDSPANFVFEVVDAPRNVGYSLTGDVLTIIANQNWHGATSLTYRSRDDQGLWSKPATVDILVTPSPMSQVEAGEAIMQVRWHVKNIGR